MRRIILVLSCIFWGVLITFLLTGCSGSNGWSVQFGIVPVNAVQNTQAFDKKNYSEAKYQQKKY